MVSPADLPAAADDRFYREMRRGREKGLIAVRNSEGGMRNEDVEGGLRNAERAEGRKEE
jgi:hypothetical protein